MKLLNPHAVLVIALAASSCNPTKTTTSNKSTSNTSTVPTTTNTGTIPTTATPTPGPTGGTNNAGCYGSGVGEGASEYYTTPSIVRKGITDQSATVWASNTDTQLSSSQNTFRTDSRFNVRILAYPAPGKGTYPNNIKCNYIGMGYTKLQARVKLRKPGSTGYYKSFLITDIPVDGCSQVFEFRPPASSQPWIVELYDVQWDYSCIDYANQGFPNVPGYCPYHAVWQDHCYELSIQYSTDYTKDIPR